MRSAVSAALAGVALLAPSALCAAPGFSGPWNSLHVFGGATHPDPRLAGYHWDVGARPVFGAELAFGWDRLGIGARYVSARNEQGVSNPLVSYAVEVETRTLEVIAPVRLLDLGGLRISGCAGAGRLHLSYEPDRIVVPAGDGEPLRIDLASVDTWTGSLGGALRHAIVGPMEVGISARHRWFELDTAHRAGEEIVYEKESFGQWEIQLEAGWRIGL
jgi:hypothetical protein